MSSKGWYFTTCFLCFILPYFDTRSAQRNNKSVDYAYESDKNVQYKLWTTAASYSPEPLRLTAIVCIKHKNALMCYQMFPSIICQFFAHVKKPAHFSRMANILFTSDPKEQTTSVWKHRRRFCTQISSGG